MKDELGAERMGGRNRKVEGEKTDVTRNNSCILKLSELGRMDDMVKAAKDKGYQEKLFKEFGL